MSSQKRKRDIDSDEEVVAPGRQILPVANLPETFDGVPEDGLQYLFTVRRDARKLPLVTRVANPFEKAAPTLPPPRNFDPSKTHPSLPSEEWRALFENRFRNFRKNMNQPTIHVHIPDDRRKVMPDKKERDLWWAFLAGKPESEWNPPKQPKQQSQSYARRSTGMRAFADDPEPDSEIYDEADVLEETWRVNDEGEVELAMDATEPVPSTSGTLSALPETLPPESSMPPASTLDESLPQLQLPREPTTALLKHIDQRMSLHLLMYFAYWINLHLTQRNPQFPRLTEAHARWIFVLLAQVEDHISANDMSMLRSLVRACIELLKAIIQDESGLAIGKQPAALDPGMEVKSSEAPMSQSSCWIIVSAVIEIWGQRDLWMDAEDMLKTI